MRVWPIILASAVGAGFFILVQTRQPPTGPAVTAPVTTPLDAPPRARAERVAQQLVDGKLVAPATARWISTREMEVEGDQHLVHVVVDAQNAMGALLRNGYCVVVKFKPGDSVNFFYNEQFAVQECDREPNPIQMAIVKDMNGWTMVSAQATAVEIQAAMQAGAPGSTARAIGKTLEVMVTGAPEVSLKPAALSLSQKFGVRLRSAGFATLRASNGKAFEDVDLPE